MRRRKSRLPIFFALAMFAGVLALGYFIAQRMAIPVEPAIEDGAAPALPPQVVEEPIVAQIPSASATKPEISDPRPPMGLDTQIKLLSRQFGGEVGVSVRSIDNGWSASFRGDDFFPQQSVSKLWVAATVMHKIDSGEIALNEPITLTKADLSIFHQPIRKKILANGSFRTTIAKLLWYAMTQSDNAANDALFRRAGGQAGVQNFFADVGLRGIRMGAGEKALQMQISGMEWQDSFSYGKNFWVARGKIPDEQRAAAIGAYIADPVDGAQPTAIAEALSRLARGDLLSAQSSAYLVDLMAQSKTGPKRLRGGLSAGWSLPHKTGTGQVLKLLATGYNDIGILKSPAGKSYAVVVLIGATNRTVAQRQELMQSVIRAVINCEDSGQGC